MGKGTKPVDIFDMAAKSDDYEHVEGYDILAIIQKYIDKKTKEKKEAKNENGI